jgi:hypothetical protein
MKNIKVSIKESAKVIGQVLGLVMGDKFVTPSARTLRDYPDIPFTY